MGSPEADFPFDAQREEWGGRVFQVAVQPAATRFIDRQQLVDLGDSVTWYAFQSRGERRLHQRP